MDPEEATTSDAPAPSSDPPVIPERTARVDAIVARARVLVEDAGWEALSTRILADDLGIRAPSLYKHLSGKEELRTLLLTDAFIEIGTRCWEAVRSAAVEGEESAVGALLTEYRSSASGSAELYRLATTGPLDRSALPPGLEEWAGTPFFEATGDPVRAQALWAAAHGLAILEVDGRFPPGSDLDAAWQALAHAFDAG
ncbi:MULTISPECIES: TetR/AcrR family transcriptional regulator [Brevibacterium]|uniref:TetR/AcrR family transcriptional regulator n=1 Tax=Brevibacterium TaxID=1696 RepID=UPI000C771133|nr:MULTISPECIES: WHG domain-containing protein [Brevibacterium]QCP06595.1 TetR/AcrR family transcriptional regulator [Brevibacterium sp. CS2]